MNQEQYTNVDCLMHIQILRALLVPIKSENVQISNEEINVTI